MFKRSTQLLLTAFVLRILLLLYGEWHDATHLLKYTDIDYEVFHDGAGFVADHKSPYLRKTFRYTPLLAWILYGNHALFKSFGKLVFVICVGWFLLKITNGKGDALVYTTWLFNPYVMTISTRGNSESVIAALILSSVYFLQRDHLTLSAIMYGLAVHVKIYPIIYSISFLVYLGQRNTKNIMRKIITWKGFIFGLVSATTFFSITGVMYSIYGWDFLENTYLYHIGRKDHRHNFSVYNYFIYLTYNKPVGDIYSLFLFVPQIFLAAVIGFKYGSDLSFALFVQTFSFVTFNKVCTSQYFIWFISFIAPVLATTKLKMFPKGFMMIMAWIAGQAAWLRQAYRLEMLGENTFFNLWVCSIVFFLVNSWIIGEFISNFERKKVNKSE